MNYTDFRSKFKGKTFIKNGKEISVCDFFLHATHEQIEHPESVVEIKDKRFWEDGKYLLETAGEEDEC